MAVIISPENFDCVLVKQLLHLLDTNDNWKIVAESFDIFSHSDIQILSKSKHPAEKLLSELGARLCTLDLFCDVLKSNQLYDILMLFKEKEPAQIIEETCTTGDKNLQMVIRGTKFVLTAKAIGMPPPKYQWYHNSNKIKGETKPVLEIENFGPKCEGKYFCLITQEGSRILSSNPITLLLAPERPIILHQPSVQEVCTLGAKVTLFVKAKGYPKLNYQWFKGNLQLDGCTQPKLLVDINHVSQEGKYRCYIYNSAGEIWSNESTITVYVTPYPEPSAKLALLIANQNYDNLNKLYKPENDVKTLADLLQTLGFSVMSLQNLNLIEMRNAIRIFTQLLPTDAYVVFYFAGHGFEIQDKFMLPIDTPGPEDYLKSHAICEKELLRSILSSKPKLLLQLFDMCLKPPSPLNKEIFQETTNFYEYKANNNLIQGYSTTSYLGAYEKKTGKNGLYVEHLKAYLTREKDLPIVEILQKVAKDVAAVCLQQKPFFGTNVTEDYRLTDRCDPNPSVIEKFNSLSILPKDLILKFKKVNVDSEVTFSSYMNVFWNTLEIRFSNLQNFKATCEVIGEELNFELTRDNSVLVMKIMNIQKLITNKSLTLSLIKNNELMDCAILDIGKPMIAVADLWWDHNFTR